LFFILFQQAFSLFLISHAEYPFILIGAIEQENCPGISRVNVAVESNEYRPRHTEAFLTSFQEKDNAEQAKLYVIPRR